mgnify:CR=1 FL=1|tara:strand:+ start:5842 stop:6048 length:207 start_codon:yes stop_codon:yes gene_type:complete
MFNPRYIKKMADKVGGVHQLSVISDIQVSTLYRLLRGEVKPSFDTLEKLTKVIVDESLESNNENFINA